jgi:hypothetical protein
MNETTSGPQRRVTSAEVYAQARELQPKADEQEVLADAAGDELRRQFHSSAGKAYAIWATELDKTAVTLKKMEQRTDKNGAAD